MLNINTKKPLLLNKQIPNPEHIIITLSIFTKSLTFFNLRNTTTENNVIDAAKKTSFHIVKLYTIWYGIIKYTKNIPVDIMLSFPISQTVYTAYAKQKDIIKMEHMLYAAIPILISPNIFIPTHKIK